MTMIEFDDAGTGCPILGELYVARRVETDETIIRYITNEEKSKKPTVEILMGMLMELKPKETEEIHLCNGHYFDQFAARLRKNDYTVKRVTIIGKTNDLAEESFLQELWKIGMPKAIKIKKRNFAGFYAQIMVWYETFYEGKSLRKKTKKKMENKDYILNKVNNHPNLVAYLFGIEHHQKGEEIKC